MLVHDPQCWMPQREHCHPLNARRHDSLSQTVANTATQTVLWRQAGHSNSRRSPSTGTGSWRIRAITRKVATTPVSGWLKLKGARLRMRAAQMRAPGMDNLAGSSA
jgi:hypothetical protein